MSDLSPEELALLAAAEEAPTVKKSRAKKAAEPRDEDTEAPSATPARGPYTPVQFDDDGWNGLPVQMRG